MFEEIEKLLNTIFVELRTTNELLRLINQRMVKFEKCVETFDNAEYPLNARIRTKKQNV